MVGSKADSSLSIPRMDLSTTSGLPTDLPGATAEKAEAALTKEARTRAVQNFMVVDFQAGYYWVSSQRKKVGMMMIELTVLLIVDLRVASCELRESRIHVDALPHRKTAT